MRLFPILGLAAAGALAVSLPALGRPGDAQGDAVRAVRAGTELRLREIERRVLPTKRGMQYLGPEYDPAMMAYRLKFIRDGRVVFVDVDARSGEVIRESQ